jgi:Domain of unknown function (DUF3598)
LRRLGFEAQPNLQSIWLKLSPYKVYLKSIDYDFYNSFWLSCMVLMKSQWNCVLENLGEWVGSFTAFSPQGSEIEDIPSIISLVGTEGNQTIELVLNRFYPVAGNSELESKSVAMNFSAPDPGAVFFHTGAFSSGQFAVNVGVRSIGEFCLVGIDRRCRLVQVYNPALQLERVTLIREQRQGTNAPERSPLVVSDLLGTWTYSEASGIQDGKTAIGVPKKTKSIFITTDRGYQWDDDTLISLTAPSDRLLQFDRDEQSYQMLLLPDSAYSICPTQIIPGHPFYLEMGWLLSPGLRHRLIRRYDSTGKWDSTNFIVETTK